MALAQTKTLGSKIKLIKHMREVVKMQERETQQQGVSLRTGYF